VHRVNRRYRHLLLSACQFLALFAHFPAPPLHAQVEARGAQPRTRNEQVQPFTVADSIEMTHFVDPPEDDDAARPQFSPDGMRFFAVTEKGRLDLNVRDYSLVLYRTNDLHANPVALARFQSSSNRDGISQAKWLTNETIAFIGENPGETPQVYTVNCRTSELQKLTSDTYGVVAYDVTSDLRTLIYTASARGDETEIKSKDEHGFSVESENLSILVSGEWRQSTNLFQTYVVNSSNGKVQPFHGGPFAARSWVLRLWLSPDGKYAITERPAFPVPEKWESYEGWVGAEAHNLRQSGRSKSQVGALSEGMLLNTITGEIEPLTDAPAASRFNVLWSRDGRSAVVSGTYLPLADHDEEQLVRRKSQSFLVEFQIPSRSVRPIAAIPKNQLWMLEPGDNADSFVVHTREEFRALPDIAFRRAGERWIENNSPPMVGQSHPNIRIAQSLDHWPTLAIADPATHQQKVITDPNPQLQQRRLGRVQTIRWTGKLGEPWVGGLVYPTNYKLGVRCPLVIQTHGFDSNRFLSDGAYTTAMAAQELANKGIAVLQIGETPLDQEVSQKPDEGRAYVSAYESAVDYLDDLGIIDRSRVGLIGFSRTAYHVKYALTHSKYHFAAATAAEGIDFGYWQYIVEVNLPIYRGAYQNMYGGPPWSANWKTWQENSISFNFDKIHTPLRLEAADNPSAILLEWETFAALRLLNKPVDLIFIPHGEHPLAKPWDRMTSQQGNVDWFVFWLLGQEDPDPAKVAEYQHWHDLRKLQQDNERDKAARGAEAPTCGASAGGVCYSSER
jgi:dipeptidyl aminopeptidase/acylaminoacyl peptidase